MVDQGDRGARVPANGRRLARGPKAGRPRRGERALAAPTRWENARVEHIDRSLLWRAAAVQALSVAVLAAILAVVLGRQFFVDWGWLVGPGAWIACALLTARVLSLRPLRVLAGAALAGIPSALAVVAGMHWLGTIIAIGVFALWCATTMPRTATAQT